MVFWHSVALEGIKSVLSGGEPYRFDAGATLDEVNAAALAERAGSSIAGMMSELGELQNRMEEGARALKELVPWRTQVLLCASIGTVSNVQLRDSFKC